MDNVVSFKSRAQLSAESQVAMLQHFIEMLKEGNVENVVLLYELEEDFGIAYDEDSADAVKLLGMLEYSKFLVMTESDDEYGDVA